MRGAGRRCRLLTPGLTPPPGPGFAVRYRCAGPGQPQPEGGPGPGQQQLLPTADDGSSGTPCSRTAGHPWATTGAPAPAPAEVVGGPLLGLRPVGLAEEQVDQRPQGPRRSPGPGVGRRDESHPPLPRRGRHGLGAVVGAREARLEILHRGRLAIANGGAERTSSRSPKQRRAATPAGAGPRRRRPRSPKWSATARPSTGRSRQWAGCSLGWAQRIGRYQPGGHG